VSHIVDPDTLTRQLPEKDLRENVIEMARWLQWLVYFTHRSDHSPAGFPDLVLLGPRATILYIELKRDDRARLRPEQQLWSEKLLAAGQDWRLWTWTSWTSGEIERTLKED
jgi:hypothetical protein